jgi:hypothetical protein
MNAIYMREKPYNMEQSPFSGCPKYDGQFRNHTPHKLM